MQIFRGSSDKFPLSSSICSLYGKKGGLLIGPFELVLFKDTLTNSTKIISSKADAGSIFQPGDTLLGTIERFDNPQTVVGGVIKPIVWIKPSIDINSIPDVSSSKAPEVRIGDSVVLQDISGRKLATGSIKSGAEEKTFKQVGCLAIGYYVQLNTSLQTQHLGSRVLLEKDTSLTLLGMLYEVKNQEAFVFPCELLK